MEEGSAGMRDFGKIAGLVLGQMAKNLLLPIRLIGWLAKHVKKFADWMEEGFAKAGPWIDGLASKLELLIRPLGLVTKGLRALGVIGDDEQKADSPPSSRRRRNLGRTALAATAIAATPAIAQPSIVAASSVETKPIRAVLPVSPIPAGGDGPVRITLDAPITIHAAPGMNPKDIAREVDEQIDASMQKAAKKHFNRRRRRYPDK